MKRHIPILVSEILAFVPPEAKIVVDGTFGHAGHSLALIDYFLEQQKPLHLRGFDKDGQVLERGKTYLQTSYPSLPETIQVQTIHDSYDTISSYLSPDKADFVLLDLGINWEHVSDASRGFSFQRSGPLDMRFDQSKGKTAQEHIQDASIGTLQSWFVDYADYKPQRAEQIAKILKQHASELHTSSDLVAVLKTLGIRHRERAPIFQALRIATNQEFEHVYMFFEKLDKILAPGGRCAILSFHSIEDRIIKYRFKDLASESGYTILTKHTVKPTRQEVKTNRAARSAQLRVIERNKTL